MLLTTYGISFASQTRPSGGWDPPPSSARVISSARTAASAPKTLPSLSASTMDTREVGASSPKPPPELKSLALSLAGACTDPCDGRTQGNNRACRLAASERRRDVLRVSCALPTAPASRRTPHCTRVSSHDEGVASPRLPSVLIPGA